MAIPFIFSRLGLLGLLLALSGCVEAYLPDVISAPSSYLVVDGFINGDGVTSINLSRTFAVGSTATKGPLETGAHAYVEEQAGSRYALRESSNGTYTSDQLTLSPAKSYRLYLTTTDGREYASDFGPVLVSPAIDAVTWQTGDTGLSIYVDSHDEKNATHYYRWETEDTWVIIPTIIPFLEYKNGVVQPITVRYPSQCWGSDKSTDISLFKTTGLSQDVVAQHLVHSLSTTTAKLHYKCSILVKQYAQTKEEYEYWELLKRNTQNIGTLTDPLPGQVTGNLHCLSNPAEPVLGYVQAHTVAEKRIFISRAELPRLWLTQTGYEQCSLVLIPVRDVLLRFPDGNVVPVDARILPDGTVTHYSATTPYCVDCRLRGSAVKPDFWP